MSAALRPATTARPRVVPEAEAPPLEVCAFCSAQRPCRYHSAAAMRAPGAMLAAFVEQLQRKGAAELPAFIGACQATTESAIPDPVLDALAQLDAEALEEAFQQVYDSESFDTQRLRLLAAHAHALAIVLDAQQEDDDGES